MDSVFVDTSALVKFYYPEDGSEKVENFLLRAERVYLSQIAITELSSALMKKIRTRTLDMDTQVLIWNAFMDDLDTGQMKLIPLDDRHYQKASDIIRNYGQKKNIRTLDSLQLVAALDAGDAKFLCADKALSTLAAQMEFRVEMI
ncbi:MAG: type II toxin-antitoxin system VapC family toxin [Deltaproteobacteria bacterium]|nr:type II toxin-antitoxin system VapC family toxin [Deltaproteobacteria bacterium]